MCTKLPLSLAQEEPRDKMLVLFNTYQCAYTVVLEIIMTKGLVGFKTLLNYSECFRK